MLAAGKRDHPVDPWRNAGKLPPLQLPVIAGAMAKNFRDPLHQFERILIDPAQNQGALVRGQGEPETYNLFYLRRLGRHRIVRRLAEK